MSRVKYFRCDDRTDELLQMLLAQLQEQAVPGTRLTMSDSIRVAIHAGVGKLLEGKSNS